MEILRANGYLANDPIAAWNYLIHIYTSFHGQKNTYDTMTVTDPALRRRGPDPAYPQTASTFFQKLPVPVRNIIYKHVFAGSMWIPQQTKPHKRSPHFNCLLTCRRMFDDAISLYYAATTLEMAHSGHDTFKTLPAEALRSTTRIQCLNAEPGYTSGWHLLQPLKRFASLRMCVLQPQMSTLRPRDFPRRLMPEHDEWWVMAFITRGWTRPQDMLLGDLGTASLAKFRTAVVRKFRFDLKDIWWRPSGISDRNRYKVSGCHTKAIYLFLFFIIDIVRAGPTILYVDADLGLRCCAYPDNIPELHQRQDFCDLAR